MLTRKQKKEILKESIKGLFPKWIVARHEDLDISLVEAKKFINSLKLDQIRWKLSISYAILFVERYLLANPKSTDDQLENALIEEGFVSATIWRNEAQPLRNSTAVDKNAHMISAIRTINDITHKEIISLARTRLTDIKMFDSQIASMGLPDTFVSPITSTPPINIEKDILLSRVAFKVETFEDLAICYDSEEENVPGWLMHFFLADTERKLSVEGLNKVALTNIASEKNSLKKAARLPINYYAVFSSLNFTPHAGQKDFFDIYYEPSNYARFNVLLAGRRFGKTVSCAILGTCEMLQPDATVCVIAPNYRNAEIVFTHIVTLLRDQLGLEPSEKNMREKKIKLSNGSMLIVVSAENAKSILGFEPSLTIFEEAANIPGGRKIFEEIIRPATSTATSDLGSGKGRVVFISTPVYGSYLEEYYYRGLTKEGQKAGWRSWKFPSDVNPIVLQSGDMDEAKRTIGQPGGMSEDAFAREYLAEWAAPEGTVYEEFSVETHLVNMEDFEERKKDLHVEYAVGIDPGFTHPWAFVLAAYIPVYDEWWVLYSYKVQKKPATYHNDRFFEILDELGINFNQIEHIFYDYAAPQAIADLQAANSEWWANQAVKHVDSGRNYIKELLANKKMFVVEDNCPDLIKEFMDLAFKETKSGDIRIDKVNDDCLDALRYCVFSYVISVLGGSNFEKEKQENISEFSFL